MSINTSYQCYCNGTVYFETLEILQILVSSFGNVFILKVASNFSQHTLQARWLRNVSIFFIASYSGCLFSLLIGHIPKEAQTMSQQVMARKENDLLGTNDHNTGK